MWTIDVIDGMDVDLFQPESGTRALGVLLFLHDRDGITLPSIADAATWLDGKPLAVACPHGGECWWTSRLCQGFLPQLSAERWLCDELLPSLKALWGNVPIALAGIGMGGLGALRIAFKHPEIFPVVATLDAAVDCHDLYYEGTLLDELYSSREHCRQDSPVLHVNQIAHPGHIFMACASASRWERGNDRLHEKLSALGVPHHYTTEQHEVSLAAMLQFAFDAIQTESRRLF